MATFSRSNVEIHSPPVLITSVQVWVYTHVPAVQQQTGIQAGVVVSIHHPLPLLRSVIFTNPSASIVATSPVKNHSRPSASMCIMEEEASPSCL